MIRTFAAALLLALAMPLQAAEELIQLDITVSVDGEIVSEPLLAMKPGSDASLMQGLDGGEGLKVIFHALHVTAIGVDMLIDIDTLAGVDDRVGEHFRSWHREYAWQKASEFVVGLDNGHSVTVSITTSMTTRAALQQ